MAVQALRVETIALHWRKREILPATTDPSGFHTQQDVRMDSHTAHMNYHVVARIRRGYISGCLRRVRNADSVKCFPALVSRSYTLDYTFPPRSCTLKHALCGRELRMYRAFTILTPIPKRSRITHTHKSQSELARPPTPQRRSSAPLLRRRSLQSLNKCIL